MTNEEVIDRLKMLWNIIGINNKYLNESFTKAIVALEEKEKYRWHDLRKNTEDLPNVKGFGYVPCFIIKEYSSVPEYCEYEFFE